MTTINPSSPEGRASHPREPASRGKRPVPDETDAAKARDEQLRQLMTWAWRDAAMEPQRRSASAPRSASPRQVRTRKAINAARAAMTAHVDRAEDE